MERCLFGLLWDDLSASLISSTLLVLLFIFFFPAPVWQFIWSCVDALSTMCFFVLFQCWENCELLQSNFQVWGAMCEEKEICVSINKILHLQGYLIIIIVKHVYLNIDTHIP